MFVAEKKKLEEKVGANTLKNVITTILMSENRYEIKCVRLNS